MSQAQPSLVPEIDFAQPQPAFDRGVPWPGWAMLVAATILAGLLVADHAAQLARRDRAESQLRSGGHNAAGGSAVSGPVAAEIGFVDEALVLGRIPWENVFRDLEAAKDPKILLLGLNLRGARREVQLSGEAADFAALSAYMASLGARPGLADVRLLGHQPLARGDTAAIRFELLLHWRAE